MILNTIFQKMILNTNNKLKIELHGSGLMVYNNFAHTINQNILYCEIN